MDTTHIPNARSSLAWDQIPASRFDARPSPDTTSYEPTFREWIRDMPAWAHIGGGAVLAAIMGAMLGGALHI